MKSYLYRSSIESFLDAYNRFDIDGMLQYVHPEIHFRNITGGVVTAESSGREDFQALAEHSRDLFTSRNQHIVLYSEDGNVITVEIVFEGCLRTGGPAGPGAGDIIRLEGKSAYTFRDGLIYRLTDHG